MRKIEQLMCDAIEYGKNWSNANTRVEQDPDSSSSYVYLHGNHIATVTDNDVTIYDGGWQTVTTKSRLNAICDRFCIAGEGVFQRKGEWFIHKLAGMAGPSKVFNEVPFTNGYIFS